MKLHAKVLLIGLTALCSACVGYKVPPAPVIVTAALCPAPVAPVLPQLDASLPFDSFTNAQIFLIRDDSSRNYIKALQTTIRCYELQIKKDR